MDFNGVLEVDSDSQLVTKFDLQKPETARRQIIDKKKTQTPPPLVARCLLDRWHGF